MGKWISKEEVEEIIGALPLENEIEVLNIYQNSPEVVIVCIAGFTSSLDLKVIGEAFGDDNIWIQAVGVDKFNLTIVVKEK